MTIPVERFRAIKYARRFLSDLLNPKMTKRIPKEIRRESYYRLKHFIQDYELAEIAKCPRCSKIIENDEE